MVTPKKKFTLVTRHYFSSHNRKTTVHFLAREFAKRGYEVNFVTVGRSRLSCLNKNKAKAVPSDLSREKFLSVEENIQSIVMDEYIHPFSSHSKIIKFLTNPYFLRYGKTIPNVVKKEVADSDIVLIECGYGVAYFKALKELCTKAKFVYFATDPLSQVGLRSEFEDIEQSVIEQFDVVRVASSELGERFPATANVKIIPQGLDKSIFDNAQTSPYSENSFNFISIGDMSFDAQSIIAMAKSKPDAFFHIFGADIIEDYPENIIVHGEVEFTKLVPYIKFADVGIMPYKMNAHMSYLTKTSLKFLQYSYSGLPIITPQGPDWEREKMFLYSPDNNESIVNAVAQASKTPKDQSLGNGIIDWGNCTDKLIDYLK